MNWLLPLILTCTPQPDSPPKNAAKPAPPVAVEKGVRHALILCGHPGDAAHVKTFTETVVKLGTGLTKTLGIAAERQHVVFGTEPPKELAGATGPATREAVTAAVADIRKALRPEDGLWVICLGHGHHDGRQAWWNLPGPDINAGDFGKLFADIACREQVFIMTMSLSGYFVRPLAHRNRVVIAATEADAETNETIFPNILAQVLNTDLNLADHDVDKDGKLSLFDLYVFVAKEVAQSYLSAEEISTEHAQLEDDGDGIGHEVQTIYLPPELGGPAPDKKKSRTPPKDGLLAARILLLPGNPVP